MDEPGRQTRRWASVLAWSLFVAFVALVAVALWDGSNGHGTSDDTFAVLAAGFAVVGAVVASRQPTNAVGWLLLSAALVIAFGAFGEAYALSSDAPGRVWVAWVTAWSWYVWLVCIIVYLPLLFPTGRLPSRRWRAVGWLGAAALVLAIVPDALRPGDLDLKMARIDNPVAFGPGTDALTVIAVAGNVCIAACLLLAGSCLVVRFRSATGTEREQLKWFALAGVGVLAGAALPLLGQLFPGLAGKDLVGFVGWALFFVAAFVGLPLAIGLAILRYRLYEIDVVINRTLVYGALTAVLGSAYLGSVLLLQLVLAPVTSQSDLAVAGSTLAVAALFRPARTAIQRAVDRRFYRRRYDAQRTVDAFAGRLRAQLDLQSLGQDLREVVDDTMQPVHVSLWLRSAP